MDAILQFTVTNQILERTDEFTVVEGSENYLRAHFTFATSDWDGMIKTGVFINEDGTMIPSLCEDDTCEVPVAWLREQKGAVGVIGSDGETKITTNAVKVRIRPNGYDEEEIEEETKTYFDQLLAAFAEKYTETEAQAKLAQRWAVGLEEEPETLEDNAKYYAGQAKNDVAQTQNDRNAVSELSEHVDTVAMQVNTDKTEAGQYKEQAAVSATNTLQSEQAAKSSETAAKEAQAGAETAEGQAELHALDAAASASGAELAKTQAQENAQQASEDRDAVQKLSAGFSLTCEKAIRDINTAGENQVNAVDEAGQEALNNIGTGVDSSLTEYGKAADAGVTGKEITELKGDLGELKNVVGITEKQKIEWESGKVTVTSDGFVYSGGSNFIRTKEPIKLKAGDSVSISDNTTYNFSLHYIATDGTYGLIAHPDYNPKIAQVDGDYCIVIQSRDASSLVDKVQEVSSLITVEISQPLSGILGDMEQIINTVNEKQDTLIAGNGIHIAEDGRTISTVGSISGGKSIPLSNILNPQSISANAGSVTSENGIYTITANGAGSEPRLIIKQAYEANHRYMLIASVCGDYSEHKPASIYSRVEEGSINHFSEWVNSKNIPTANVSLDCRNCYHIFEISTSGSYRTSFTVNFGTVDNANGAVFKISNIALIDVTEIDVDYRVLATAIFAQLNGIVTENDSVDLDITREYPVQNFNIALFGDSILGNYTEHEKLAALSKANVYRCAIGGTTVSNRTALSLCNLIDAVKSSDYTAQDAVAGTKEQERLDVLKSLDFSKLDYVCIEIGTNDWRQNYPIGTDDSTDTSTIKGSYNHVLSTIYAINPMVKVCLLTPLFRTQFDANTTPNDNGDYLYQIVMAVKEIANNWGVPVYDMYHNSGVNAANSTVYLLDGTHPTPIMEYRIADIIYNLIKGYIN